MNESRIILPVNDNLGRPLTRAHATLRDAIIDAFGGVTVTRGNGCWRGHDGTLYDEPVVIYDVAHADRPAARGALRSIALAACIDADQECVYLRLPDGVELIARTPADIPTAA